MDDLIRLGEIGLSDTRAGLSADREARELLNDIGETVSQSQTEELATRTASEFTPVLY